MCDRLLAPPLPNLFLSSSIGIEFQLGTQPSIWRLHFLFPVVAGCGHVTPFSSIECWRKQCVHFLYYLLYKKKMLTLQCFSLPIPAVHYTEIQTQ